MVLINKKRDFKNSNYEIVELKCQYPGCEEVFFGKKNSLYCHEHKKQKYEKSKSVDSNCNCNIKIKSKLFNRFIVNRKCDCCDKVYELEIIPKRDLYPRYCEEHRNEYKRKLYYEMEEK